MISLLNLLLGIEALNSVPERLKVEFVHSDLDESRKQAVKKIFDYYYDDDDDYIGRGEGGYR